MDIAALAGSLKSALEAALARAVNGSLGIRPLPEQLP